MNIVILPMYSLEETLVNIPITHYKISSIVAQTSIEVVIHFLVVLELILLTLRNLIYFKLDFMPKTKYSLPMI